LDEGDAKEEPDSEDDDAGSHSKSDMDVDGGCDIGIDQLDNANSLDIRDVNYNVDKLFSSPQRQLLCRNIAMAFDPATVYGSRSAFHTGLLVVAKEDPNNIFLKSKLWRLGVVTDIQMLPRADMFKEPCAAARPSKCCHTASNACLTHQQCSNALQ
jgi:hypothetical protein